MSDTAFEIRIVIDRLGQMTIHHPDGASELIHAIYYLELARGTLMAKSVQPHNGASRIIPARISPQLQ